MRILYVEDNETNQALVGRVVRARRHKILFCEEGEQALEMLKQSSDIDLVLLDIELAGAMSGVEVVKQLRAEGDKRPVVAVTAYAMMGDRERILEAGCDQYLPKPLVITDLLALIDHYEKVIDEAGAGPAPSPAVTATAAKNGHETASGTVLSGSKPAEPAAATEAPPASSAAAPEPKSGTGSEAESTQGVEAPAEPAPETTATDSASPSTRENALPPVTGGSDPVTPGSDEASSAKPAAPPESVAAPDVKPLGEAAQDDQPGAEEPPPERVLAEAELTPNLASNKLKEGEQP